MHGYTICAVMCAVPFRQARDDILSLYRAEAGITVSVSKVKEISNTYDQLYGVDSTLLSRALGFSPTVTRQITMIGSYTIPSDGRQRELRIRPVDEVYYYSVYQGKKSKGIGSARRVIGVEFSAIQSDLE